MTRMMNVLDTLPALRWFHGPSRRLFSALTVVSIALLLGAFPPREARAVEMLDQSQTATNWGTASFGLFPGFGIITAMQRFTAGLTGNLTKVDLLKVYLASGSVPFLVEIMAVDGSGYPTGPALGSGSYSGPGATSYPGGWVTVPLTSPAPVSAGTSYAIVLTSGTGKFGFLGGRPGSGGYPDALQYLFGSWDDSGVVMAFQTYVDVTNQAPVANAGSGQTVTVPHDGNPTTNTASFTLNGSGSSDPDGDSLSYQWKQGSTVVGSTASVTLSRPAGAYTFTLTVTDPYGASDSKSVQVIVNPEPNQAPTLTVPASLWVNAGSLLTFTATGTDPEGDTLTFSLVSPPAGATINATSGAFSWTPAAAGNFSVSVKVSDPYGASDTKTVSVTVSALAVESVSLTRNGSNVTVKFNLRKPGTVDATNVRLTAATLRGVNTSTPLPILYDTIKAGTFKQVTLQFMNVATGPAVFTVTGTSANGLISANLQVTVP